MGLSEKLIGMCVRQSLEKKQELGGTTVKTDSFTTLSPIREKTGNKCGQLYKWHTVVYLWWLFRLWRWLRGGIFKKENHSMNHGCHPCFKVLPAAKWLTIMQDVVPRRSFLSLWSYSSSRQALNNHLKTSGRALLRGKLIGLCTIIEWLRYAIIGLTYSLV